MALKRTRKDQIDSGKKELPRQVAFLRDMKVEFLSFAQDDAGGEITVELAAAVVKAMARKGAELKELKMTQKDLVKQAAQLPALQKDLEELPALREAAASTAEELRKARQRIKALEKELGIEPGAKVRPAMARKAVDLDPVTA
jgi:chromosome segregation ATPase